MKSTYEEFAEKAENRRLLAQEGLVLEGSELVARLMNESGVTRSELAKRIGKTRSYVTQLLSGSRNMTLRTLADIAFALGAEVKMEAVPIEKPSAVTGDSARSAA